jgi:hypothetical protein
MRISRSLLNKLCFSYYVQRTSFPSSPSLVFKPDISSLDFYQPQFGNDPIEEIGRLVREIVMKEEGNVAKRVLDVLNASGVTDVYVKLCKWNREDKSNKCRDIAGHKSESCKNLKNRERQDGLSQDKDKYMRDDMTKSKTGNDSMENNSEYETDDTHTEDAEFPYEDLEKTPVSPRLWFAWKQCEFLEHLRANEWDQAVSILREEMSKQKEFFLRTSDFFL